MVEGGPGCSFGDKEGGGGGVAVGAEEAVSGGGVADSVGAVDVYEAVGGRRGVDSHGGWYFRS